MIGVYDLNVHKSLFVYESGRMQLECSRVLQEDPLVSVLMYKTETLVWKEKKRSRIWDVQNGV